LVVAFCGVFAGRWRRDQEESLGKDGFLEMRQATLDLGKDVHRYIETQLRHEPHVSHADRSLRHLTPLPHAHTSSSSPLAPSS
jgi:hypothetical protein